MANRFICDWIAPTYFTEEDSKNVVDGTFVEDKYRSVLNMVDEFTQKRVLIQIILQQHQMIFQEL